MQRDVITAATQHLMTTDVYWGYFLSQTRVEVTTRVPTAAFCFRDRPYIYLNPNFIDWLTEKAEGSAKYVAGVMKHELKHMIFDHLITGKMFHEAVDESINVNDLDDEAIVDRIYKQQVNNSIHQLLNMAQDYIINEGCELPSNIPSFDKEGKLQSEEGKPCFLSDLSQQLGLQLDTSTNYIHIYHLLRKNKEKVFCGGKGGPRTLDTHGLVDPNADPEKVKDRIKRMMSMAKQTAGNVPAGDAEFIKAAMDSKLPWDKLLRDRLQGTLDITKSVSKIRRNRRYGFTHPGSRSFPKGCAVFIVDTSGSMHTERLQKAYSEVVGACQGLGISVIIIECDADVQSIYRYTGGDIEFNVKGRGGTLVAPAYRKIKSEYFVREYGEVKHVVYFTDAGIFDLNEITPEIQTETTWIVPIEEKGFKPSFGEVILADI